MKISPVNMEARKNLDLQVGDTISVFQKIQEKGKTRLQEFQGLVLARKHGSEPGATFTVRRSTDGYGVEKIFPLYSPMIEKIEVVKRSKTRRAKLYNIRRQALKQISKRMKMMMVSIKSEEETPVEEQREEVSEETQPTETTDTPEVVEEKPKEEKQEEPAPADTKEE